jgi:hypothetical protein
VTATTVINLVLGGKTQKGIEQTLVRLKAAAERRTGSS